jgi:hypothetical protein
MQENWDAMMAVVEEYEQRAKLLRAGRHPEYEHIREGRISQT